MPVKLNKMAVSKFLKSLRRKRRKHFKLNNNKTLKVNKNGLKIFKEYLKGKNENCNKCHCVKLDKL